MFRHILLNFSDRQKAEEHLQRAIGYMQRAEFEMENVPSQLVSTSMVSMDPSFVPETQWGTDGMQVKLTSSQNSSEFDSDTTTVDYNDQSPNNFDDFQEDEDALPNGQGYGDEENGGQEADPDWVDTDELLIEMLKPEAESHEDTVANIEESANASALPQIPTELANAQITYYRKACELFTAQLQTESLMQEYLKKKLAQD